MPILESLLLLFVRPVSLVFFIPSLPFDPALKAAGVGEVEIAREDPTAVDFLGKKRRLHNG